MEKNNSTAVGLLVFYGHKFYHKLIFLSYHIKLSQIIANLFSRKLLNCVSMVSSRGLEGDAECQQIAF